MTKCAFPTQLKSPSSFIVELRQPRVHVVDQPGYVPVECVTCPPGSFGTNFKSRWDVRKSYSISLLSPKQSRSLKRLSATKLSQSVGMLRFLRKN